MPGYEDEPRRAKLPPELERIRALDQEAHVQAARRAGLSGAQAVAHAGGHMEERAAEEYRAPADHGHPGTKTSAYRRAQRRIAGEPSVGAGATRAGAVRTTPGAERPAAWRPPGRRVEDEPPGEGTTR